jgi:hypothetical protein
MTQNIGNAIGRHGCVDWNTHSTDRLKSQIRDEPIPTIFYVQSDMIAMADTHSEEPSGLMVTALMKAFGGYGLPFSKNLCRAKDVAPLTLHHSFIQREK